MPSNTGLITDDEQSSARVPAYQRIEDDIRMKVRDGRLPAGTMLASRHKLAREYGVALSTAQQAIARLLADNTLETFDRRGTFVAHPPNGSNGNGKNANEAHALSHLSGMITPLGDKSIDQFRSTGPSQLLQTNATLGIIATARVDSTASPDVGSLWARLAIRSLEEAFSVAGGTTRYLDRYIAQTGRHSHDLEELSAVPISKAIAMLLAEGVKALAIVGLCDTSDMSDEVVHAFDVEQVPTVYISWHEVQPPLAQVFYDNRYAGYQAAQHLLRQGYRQLIFLVPFNNPWLMERVEGARSAVRQAKLPEDTLRLYPAEPLAAAYDPEDSASFVQSVTNTILEERCSINAPIPLSQCGIIAPNDDTAYSVIHAASLLGKTAGKDFGLTGFDDDPRSSAIGLTTVRPPVEAMGREAGRLVLRALQGDKHGQSVRLRSQLIPRTTTLLRIK
jgi:DNA-binding LacI/PurR family transcriptional regulator/DNA-binding transcriptional regulator YhcF (GntR family)